MRVQRIFREFLRDYREYFEKVERDYNMDYGHPMKAKIKDI